MIIQLLHKRRFVTVEGATAALLAANCWSVTLPLTDAVKRMVPRSEQPEAWDGAILMLDGFETEPAVWSAATAEAVTVTVLR